MQRSNVGDPSYYHKVVDCQWGCPAHTNVPEYIRLIAQGRYDDAYMLNRESNVFPGILGRTCDRPCEPACRRTRVDGKPVAICRLKRVAADHKGDISARLPKAPGREERQEGGAHRRRPGVADRGQRPDAARLRGDDLREVRPARRPDAGQHPVVPAAARGARRGDRGDRRHGRRRPLQHAGRQPRRAARRQGSSTPCSSAAARPRARSSRSPAAATPTRSSSASSGSSRSTSAMSSRRQAGADHRRRQHGDGLLPLGQAPRRHRRQGHRPQDPQVLQGLAVGARGRRGRGHPHPREPAAGALHHRGRRSSPGWSSTSSSARRRTASWCRRRPAARSSRATRWCWPSARTTPSRGSSATSASSSTRSGTCRWSTRPRSCRPAPGVFFGGDAAFGPANIIWAVEHGHQAAISVHNYCQGQAGHRASAAGHDAQQHQDGAARVGLQQQLRPGDAPEDEARRHAAALQRA